MDRLIPVANQIRDALASVRLDQGALELPQIAVVGGQSVGKSSLLEGLVGRAFLPTGSGVVTRRPLILRLANATPEWPASPGPAPQAAASALGSGAAAAASERGGAESRPEGAQGQEWGEFGHLPGRRFESFDAIREEILHDTEKVCGDRAGISRTPIVLKITSPHVIDLTLVDLPGIARVPVGDQPQDIECQIRELVLEHVSNPRCFILAVVAGNADLATADALALAREVDPDGVRTLGVVTKLDLADHGADALPVLEGRVYPLRQGFIGVVCRSFGDVKQGKGVKEHLEAEDQFFRNHPKYKRIAQRCGISYLSKRLNRILMDHICDALPDIRNQARQLILELEVELQSHGESVTGRPPSDQGALLLSLFSKFSGRFGDAIEGKLSAQVSEASGPSGQLVGRARIDYIFRDVFAKTVREFDCFSGLSDDEIRVAIRNATGPRATLFVPEAAFELLARKQISKLQVPSLQCADLVYDELQRVLLLSELPEFRHFINLREQIFNVVRDILRRSLEPTCQMIRDVIAIELAYINTSHPDFVGAPGALRGASAVGGSSSSMAPRPPAEQTNGAGPSASGPSSQPQLAQSTTRGSLAPASGPEALPTERRPELSSVGGMGGFFSGFGIFRPQSANRRSYSSSTGSFASDQAEPMPLGEVGAAPRPQTLHMDGAAGPGSAWSGGGNARQSATLTAGGGLKLPHVPPSITPASAPPNQRERVEVSIIKMMLENYLAIVKKNVADSVPKAVMFFMVNTLKDMIQSECVARLYKEDLFGGLLQEAPDVQDRRTQCHARLQALKRVMEVTEQVRDCAELP